ncbi:PGF-pre-PGF domain-containing protein [Candidatus Woesearchaeota archaeon]|nr:PGF-pre-PGF domain-containing protein [Candidatus Woesearchaeota archaeon]
MWIVVLLVLPVVLAATNELIEDDSLSENELSNSIVDASDKRVWLNIEPGMSLKFESRSVDVFGGELRFVNEVSVATLYTVQYSSKPPFISELPAKIYKFYSLDLKTAPENVDKFGLTFSIPDKWFDETDILPEEVTVYRLEDEVWVPYKPEVSRVFAHNLHFTVALPGFSFFAIGEEVDIPTEEVEIIEDPVDLNETPEPEISDEEISEVDEVVFEESPVFVSDLKPREKRDSTGGLWIVGLFGIVAILGSFGSLQYFKTHKKHELKRLEQIKRDQKHLELQKKANRGDPLATLQHYVMKMRAKDMHPDEIRERLLAVGWDPIIVEQEMMRLDEELFATARK